MSYKKDDKVSHFSDFLTGGHVKQRLDYAVGKEGVRRN